MHTSAPPLPTLSHEGRGGAVAGTVEGYARLHGRIPARRAPCSALQRALSHEGRGGSRASEKGLP